MNKTFVSRFMEAKPNLEAVFSAGHPSSYIEVVRSVIREIQGEEYGEEPSLDPERIVEIDHGAYQGTLLYVIAEKGYQPSSYWSVFVSYGSCSGCDTLQAIAGYQYNTVTQEQVDQYMTLALHIVQGLKKIGEPE